MRIVSILLLAIALTGCAANQAPPPTNLPAGVTVSEVQNWDKAVKALNAISVTAKSGTDDVIALNRAGIFKDGAAYVATLGAIKKMDLAGIEGAKYLQTVPNQWGVPIQGKVASILAGITAALQDANKNGLAGIKDPASVDKFNKVIAAFQVSIAIIQATLSLSTQVSTGPCSPNISGVGDVTLVIDCKEVALVH